MKRIGVLGGGQLGMMLFEAKGQLPISLTFLDPDPECSCTAVGAEVISGDFKDYQAVLDFGTDKDVITVEIEHVNTEALKALQGMGKAVFPQPDILEMIQDKGLQKQFYADRGFPTAPFELVHSAANIDEARWSIPYVMKSRKGGYDGKGVQVVREETAIKDMIAGPLVVEELADLALELSVIVARNQAGQVSSFPLVEMEFDPTANLVSALISPASVSEKVVQEATSIAERLIEELGLVGLLAVELFLLKDGTIWINEVAPRPHNSGHQTIEGNQTSQYEQHLRAISGMDLGDTGPHGVAVMVNLLGQEGHNGAKVLEGAELVKSEEGAYLHDYHKAVTRPFRKMGHITVVGQDRQEVLEKALSLQSAVRFRT